MRHPEVGGVSHCHKQTMKILLLVVYFLTPLPRLHFLDFFFNIFAELEKCLAVKVPSKKSNFAAIQEFIDDLDVLEYLIWLGPTFLLGELTRKTGEHFFFILSYPSLVL